MKSRETKRREAWQLIAWVGAVVGVLLVFRAAVEGSMIWLLFFQTIAAFVTAGIVWWYTKETQRLREAAQQQIEVQQRPFIIVEPRRQGPLIVRNIGNSAAININITVLKGTSAVMIPLLTHGSGISIMIDTNGDRPTYTYMEEGVSSHNDSLFIDYDSIQNNFTLHVEYQNVAMHTYVTEERITPERFEILRS